MTLPMHETPQDEASRLLAIDQQTRQTLKLRLASPMRSAADQRDAGHLALFVAANEPSFF